MKDYNKIVDHNSININRITGPLLNYHKQKAYEVIKELNAEMKAQNPRAIVVNGKVNRIWYEEACLLQGAH